MINSMLSLPGLSPVSGKSVVATFDGDRRSFVADGLAIGGGVGKRPKQFFNDFLPGGVASGVVKDAIGMFQEQTFERSPVFIGREAKNWSLFGVPRRYAKLP